MALDGARDRLQLVANRLKERHDAGLKEAKGLQEGQLVYLKNFSCRGRSKIQDIWNPIFHIVMRAPGPEGAVYSVAPLTERQKVKTVHGSMLKLVPANLHPPKGPAGLTDAPEDEDATAQDVVVLVTAPTTRRGPSLGAHALDGPLVHSPDHPVGGQLEDGPGLGPQRHSQEEANPIVLRRTTRKMAGQHPNPHHLPDAMRVRQEGVASSRVPGSSNSLIGYFRPWS